MEDDPPPEVIQLSAFKTEFVIVMHAQSYWRNVGNHRLECRVYQVTTGKVKRGGSISSNDLVGHGFTLSIMLAGFLIAPISRLYSEG